MINNWKKKGLIYSVDSKFQWNKSHSQVPVVDKIPGGRLRIYYASRDLSGKSRTSYIEVEANNPHKVEYIHDKPILELGDIGTFDDSGIMPTSIINVGSKKYLYYIGWTTRGTVPFSNSIGLAVSVDGGRNFKKECSGPVIGIGPYEPYFTGTCYVIKKDEIFLAYYLSCIGWKMIDGRNEPFYDIKIAESTDGIEWTKINKTAIPLESNEGGIASASVLKLNNIYRMWFSVRGFSNYRNKSESSYRIGYAESLDGHSWKRIKKDVLKTSSLGWDSEMIAYPFVVRNGSSCYLFYNGNGFGVTGFGYAKQNITF